MHIKFICTSEELLSPIEGFRSKFEQLNFHVATRIIEASDLLQQSTQFSKESTREETVLVLLCNASELPDVVILPIKTYALGGIIVSSDDSARIMKTVLEAGFHDYVPETFLEKELVNSVSALIRENKSSCKTIAVTGTGGGAGASTIASLLTTYGSEQFNLKTALIDFDLIFGRQTSDFNYDKQDCFLTNYGSSGKSLEELHTFCVNVEPNFDLFAQPYSYDLENLADFEFGSRFIGDLKKYYELLVIDVPTRLAGFDQELFRLIDHFLMVTTADLSGLRNSANLVRWSDTLNEDITKHVIINRYQKTQSPFTGDDFKKLLEIDNLSMLNEDLTLSQYQKRLNIEKMKIKKIPREVKKYFDTTLYPERNKANSWGAASLRKFWRKK